MGGIGSTQRGIFTNLYNHQPSKRYEFESRVSKSKQMIQYTEDIMYQGNTDKILDVKDTVG